MAQNVIVLLIVLFGCGITFGFKKCSNNDCVFIDSCPEANDLKNNKDAETLRKFSNSLCGFGYINRALKPKFCCSEFLKVFLRINREEDNLERHPNLALLPTNCGEKFDNRIVGGQFAEMYEYPWMTLLSYLSKEHNGKNNPQFKCGGTIINSKYILTAAHCVQNKELGPVRVGEFDISKKIDCRGSYENYICESHIQDIDIENITIHENYSTRGNIVVNDIALLRLKDLIDFNHRNVAPICLPVSKDLSNLKLDKTKATVAGWGLTEKGKTSSILLKVELPLMNETSCFKYLYRKPKSDITQRIKTICAGGEIGKAACNGDSGGPLMIHNTYNGAIRVLQIGVVSYGPMQCGSTFPAVYTDVTKYVDWILDHIES